MAYYINMLEKLNNCTDSNHPDKKNLIDASRKLREMSGLSDKKRENGDTRERSSSKHKDPTKDQPPVHEGTLWKNKQETYAYLYNDFGGCFMAYSKKAQLWSIGTKRRSV